jgi:hypothetical protein
MSSTTSQTAVGRDASVDALRADIAETRDDLGGTVEALGAKADVKARAADAARRTTAKVREHASTTAEKVGSSVRQQPRRWAGVATGVAAAAAAVGVVAWRRNRRTPQRRAVRAWNAVTDRFGR